MTEPTKRCTECGRYKPYDAFSKNKNTADGLSHKCRGCYAEHYTANKERKAEHRAANKERIAATNAAYRAANKERIAVTNAAWYAANKEQINARNAAYYAANKEQINARNAAYYAANTASHAARVRARQRHISKHAMPSWLTETQREQMNALYETARRLTEQTGILHVVDHIWPLKGATAWGLHAPWNLQVLTGNENDSKGNKEPDSSGWYIEMEYSVAAE